MTSEQTSTKASICLNQNLDFESWMNLLGSDFLSDQDQALFLKGLQDHPEWVNQTCEHQQTPLMRASFYGCTPLVKALIQAGSHLNHQDLNGCTPLILASQYGRIDVIKELIENGADIDLQDYWATTALMQASYNADLEVVKLLIQGGANINIQTLYGSNALMRAAHQGSLEVVQELMNHGADPLVMNNRQQTALDMARQKGYHQMGLLFEAYISRQTLGHVIQPQQVPSSSLRSAETDSLRVLKKLRL